MGFGWGQATPPHDVQAFLARKAKEIERLNGVYRSILKNNGVAYFEGKGIVIDPHTVEVRGVDGSVRQLRAKNILISTGGHAVKLNIPGAEHAITSDEALVLDSLQPGLPIAIVGGGYIGVEFCGIFNGLGADVHLICRQKYPLGVFDGECRAVVAGNMQGRGIKMHMESSPTRIERKSNGSLSVYYSSKNGVTEELNVAKVMFATGRKASTKGIGLEDAGVQLDGKTGAIHVDEYSRTNVPSIWAIGDVTGRMALTPVALMEGRALAATIFGGCPTKPDYDNVSFSQHFLSFFLISMVTHHHGSIYTHT